MNDADDDNIEVVEKTEPVETKPAPRQRASRAKPAEAAPAPVAPLATVGGKQVEYKRIILEESENIPPTGLPVSVNGRAYIVQPGVEVNVPLGVLDVLRNAVVSMPVVSDQTKQVISYRDRMQYPFRELN